MAETKEVYSPVRENAPSLFLVVLIVMLSGLGFVFGGANRWSALLVGATALVAAFSAFENHQMRRAMEATVQENQRMRDAMERSRDLEVLPLLIVEWVAKWDEGKRITLLLFRNEGIGPAILRDVTFRWHIATGSVGDSSATLLSHSSPQIVVHPREVRHTLLDRDLMTRELNQAYLPQTDKTGEMGWITGHLYNVHGTLVEDIQKRIEEPIPIDETDPEIGKPLGMWMRADGLPATRS